MDGYFDFKDFIIRILKRWRLIFVCMFLFGVILGAFKGVTTLPYIGQETNLSDDSQLQKNIDNMEESIEMLDDGISNWDAYYSNSKLMHLDSYNVTVYSLIFSIRGNTALNYTDASTIAASCKDIIESGIYNSQISNDTGISENDIKDLVLVTTNQGTVEIKGYKYDDIEISKVVDALYDCLSEDMMSAYDDQYTFQKLSADYHTGRDDDLISLQDTVIANGERYISEKSSRGRVLDELNQENPSEVVTIQSAVQDIVKFFIVGCVGGIIFAIVLGLFLDLMSKRLYNEREIKNEFGLKCFAGGNILPVKKNIIDRLIENMYSTKHALTDDEWAEYVSLRIMNEDVRDNKVMFVGSILNKNGANCKRLEKLIDKLNENNISAYMGKSIISDADTVQRIGQIKDVIIVEKIGESELPLIKEEIEVINGLDKRVLGFVLV